MSSKFQFYKEMIEKIKIGDINEARNNLEKAKSNAANEYFNNEDDYGLKPIHWACLTSNFEILNWMLQEKCDIEAASKNGWRAIHFASFIGNKELVAFLIDKNCKLDCKTNNEETVSDVANGNCIHEFIDDILNANINLKIGLLMGLKCGANCKHEFCIRSVIRPTSYKPELYPSNQAIKLIDSCTHQNFIMTITRENDYHENEIKKCVRPIMNKILPYLNHQNVIKYYGLIIETEKTMISFNEWLNNGSLKNKIKGRLNNSTIYRYCKDILQAVAFLHDNKILHRFIHSKNIFIDNNDNCKLVLSNYSYYLDTGNVQIDKDWLDKYLKYSFAAPELKVNGILSYPYDILMLSCTIIEMSTGTYSKYQSIKFEDVDKMITNILNEKLQSFIRCMIIKDPKNRATAKELLNHEYIRNNYIITIFDHSFVDRKATIDRIQNEINKRKK